MKAVVHDRYGAPDVLKLADVARPEPAAGEVLVRVHAASVNARDWHAMRGDPYLARLTAQEFGILRPKMRIRGTDFAGRVEAVGAGVTRFRPGDAVFGECNGAFAEYVCAPDNAVDHMPAGLSFEQAAALPLAANTALVGLRDLGRVRPGSRVLINGASGGVGTFAIQIAKAMGAEVIAVCSTRNVDLVASLGADRVIDYRRIDFTREEARYDVVFDLVGNHSLGALRRAVAPGGKLVLSGGGVSRGGSLIGPMGLLIKAMVMSRFARGRLFVLVALPSKENLAALREFVESGRITPIIDRTYRLDETAEAIRYLEVEHARAKVILTV